MEIQGLWCYSVRSGYRVLQNLQHNSSPPFLEFYKVMWNLSSPSKIKITLWRVASNFLPTFDNLQHRRLNVRNILQTFNFPSAPISGSDSWLEWLAIFFVNLLENRRRELAVIYWVVWFFRNKLVHEGYKSSINEVSSFITAFICEQESICRPNGSARPIVVPRWEAPQEVAGKINFDSAFSCHSRSATSGIVARDNEGEYRSTSTPYYWIEEVPPRTATTAELDKRDVFSV
ncbi:hypothetical protein V6N11_077151 [Hibiscus sabdariffa]|uniref:Reverse transcriptase zinc-binding domain-containing protein n=1 Tax=Hibiscus sabdariffa TaxID=183260 RepID=A0ABR2TC77_9ROSI